jgi:hypothetical protein
VTPLVLGEWLEHPIDHIADAIATDRAHRDPAYIPEAGGSVTAWTRNWLATGTDQAARVARAGGCLRIGSTARDDRPYLIVALPRTEETLMRAMLDAFATMHPDAEVAIDTERARALWASA